jgi:hypothetical protein
VDPIFPPSDCAKLGLGKKSYVPDKIWENNKFELVFDELVDGFALKQLYTKK